MSLEAAIRWTEILLAVALIQQSLEHIFGGLRDERIYYLPRLILSALLLAGIETQWVSIGLFVSALFILHRFQGPYNGGSDLMSLLVITCLCLAHLMPNPQWQEYVFAYLALQLIFSYFKSGWSKVIHREWRTGRALLDVFAFSAYPVSEGTRAWLDRSLLLFVMAWAVVLFELLFPVVMISQPLLFAGLAIAFAFHLANYALFGFNRFVWIWVAAYPSLIWLQSRLESVW